MKKLLLFASLFACFILFAGCSNKIDHKDPISVVQNFILLCEDGKINEAEKLLAPKHNVDYFKKFKHLNNGKDLIYIDYDYKGNDDTVNISYELLENLSNSETAVVKMKSNYLKQHHSFEKVIVLNNIDGKWKIYEYVLMPVKVK